jgi:amidohydrolase
MTSFEPLIKEILPELIEFRHDLHRNPEPAYEEVRTSARILEELKKIGGLSIRTGLAGTGIAATLNPDHPGRCVLLRADLDALPIQETNTFDHRSQNDGRMHACGHDGHATCLLGAARILVAHRDELPGKVKFVFQPAEEHALGGKRMVDEGVLAHPEVDAAFALHGWPDVKLGSISVGSGPVFAAATDFEIELRGSGAHAAFPHQGTETILASAQFIAKIQAIASRFSDPTQPVVVSICAVHAGETYNTLPGQCRMLGTARSLDPETHNQTTARIERILKSTAAEFGTTAEINFAESYPPLINHSAAAALVRKEAGELLGTENVDANPAPTMGAEDFAFYARKVPSAMWCLGLCPPDRVDYPRLHQPDFDFEDAAIPLGVELHCRIARRFLVDGLIGES